MPEQQVKIENLTIRLPEEFGHNAQNLGNEVVNNVVQNLPLEIKSKRIPQMELKVSVLGETTSSQLTNLISEAILKGLV